MYRLVSRFETDNEREEAVRLLKKKFPKALLDYRENEIGRPAENSPAAKDFLLKALKDGPKSVSKLMEMAREKKIRETTLKRVSRSLPIDKMMRSSYAPATWMLREED